MECAECPCEMVALRAVSTSSHMTPMSELKPSPLAERVRALLDENNIPPDEIAEIVRAQVTLLADERVQNAVAFARALAARWSQAGDIR